MAKKPSHLGKPEEKETTLKKADPVRADGTAENVEDVPPGGQRQPEPPRSQWPEGKKEDERKAS